MSERCQLLGSEYRAVVLWIDSGIVAIPLFKVDVPSSSQCVGFSAEFSGSKPNDQVERGKVFRPSCLPTCENFGHGKILQIPVISDHVDRECRAFEIMSPSFESFKDR